ncbi:MAG: hypothetical protein V1932_00875 [Chloroflexota bacterium]
MSKNPSDKKYWLDWTIACGIGEFIGIAVAAGVGFLVLGSIGESQTTGYRILVIVIMMLAGIIEGLVTGFFQWLVLRRKLLSMKTRNWLIPTALGAATAWALGMLPSVFFLPEVSTSNNVEPSGLQIVLLATVSGLILGAIFGIFQWLELRRHVDKASRWVLANSSGWVIGLAIIYLGASIPSAETSLTIVILIGAISGLLAGFAVGAVTGLCLIQLRIKTMAGSQ